MGNVTNRSPHGDAPHDDAPHERIPRGRGRALVTGAAGFIGSHLCDALLEDGWTVRGVDSLSPFNGADRKRWNMALLGRHERFEGIEADLLHVPLEPLVDGMDAVFHLAALPGVRSSWGDAFREYSATNVELTARLLETCRTLETPRFVYASSSSVYGDAESFPVSEDAPTRPISPYGVTKLAGEHLVRLYARNFGLFTASLRFFTVYGPRQRPDMAFYRFIRSSLTGGVSHVFGDGLQTRDFTYVSDAVQSCVRALEAPRAGAVYNVGGGSRVTLREVLEIIGRETGREGRFEFGPTEAGDPKHTGADTSRARREIGYDPRVSLADGLASQVAWMKDELAKEHV